MTSLLSKMLVLNADKLAVTGNNTTSQCKSIRSLHLKGIKLVSHTFVTFDNYFVLFASRPKVLN